MIHKLLLVLFAFLLVQNAVGNRAIRSELIKALKASLPSGSEISLDNIRVPAPNDGITGLSLVSPYPPVGLISFRVELKGLQGKKKVFGTAHAKVTAPIAVAREPIKPEDNFTEKNVTFERRELNLFVATGFFSDRDSLACLKARARLVPGAVIGTAHTFVPSVVNAGQTVQLVHHHGSVKISVRVRALEGGTAERWIRVENPTTRKLILAKVVGEGAVSLQ